jgi:hypothetical protein
MADFELADDFLPVHDVGDAVATVADADRPTAWRALLDVDPLKLGSEAPVVGMLGALRMLPEVIGNLLRGARPAHILVGAPLGSARRTAEGEDG